VPGQYLAVDPKGRAIMIGMPAIRCSAFTFIIMNCVTLNSTYVNAYSQQKLLNLVFTGVAQ